MSSHPSWFLRFQKLPLVILVSLLLSGVIAGLRQLGLFERIELESYDQLVQLRSQSTPDPRILLVAIDDETLKKLNSDKVSDQALAQALKNLQQHQPRVIGVDLLRDVPIGEGRTELINYLDSLYDPLPGQPKPVILTCQLPSADEPGGIDPPPVLDLDSAIGFANIEVDPDQVIRRVPISSIPAPNVPESEQSTNIIKDTTQSNCLVPFSLGFLISLKYLQAENITLEQTKDNLFKLKDVVFQPLTATAGNYQNLDPSLYQILIDYRLNNPVEKVSFFEVLEGRIQTRQVKDKVILIGYTTKDDVHLTPYGYIPGVFIHAQVINQILDNVLAKRPVVWYLPEAAEWLWIMGWGLIGGIVVGKFRSGWLVYVVAGGVIVILVGITFIIFNQQGWLPLVSPLVAVVTSAIAAQIITQKQLQPVLSTPPTPPITSSPPYQGELPPTVISGATSSLRPTQPLDNPTFNTPKTVVEPLRSLTDQGKTMVEATGSLTPASQPPLTDSSSPPVATSASDAAPVGADSTPSGSGRREFVRSKPADPYIGQYLAHRYRIDRHIGGGGMGQVYLASDTRLRDRRVAIKVMTTYSAADNDNLIKRFDREVGFMAAFSSMNIVKINDFGLTEPESPFKGAPFYVMEYLEGTTLTQRLRQVGRLPLEEAIPIIRQICDGLREAHQLGIVHRDLKPDNIYLIPNAALGEIVKILDFGIAKIVSDGSSEHTTHTLTAMGAFVGTYRYASPEQCLGDAKIDHRTDIYSLGVLIYEMLSGTNPYNIQAEQNTQGYWISSHISRKAYPLINQPGCDALPPEINTVVMKCLEKDPEHRYANIDELEAALRTAIPNGFRNYG